MCPVAAIDSIQSHASEQKKSRKRAEKEQARLGLYMDLLGLFLISCFLTLTPSLPFTFLGENLSNSYVEVE